MVQLSPDDIWSIFICWWLACSDPYCYMFRISNVLYQLLFCSISWQIEEIDIISDYSALLCYICVYGTMWSVYYIQNTDIWTLYEATFIYKLWIVISNSYLSGELSCSLFDVSQCLYPYTMSKMGRQIQFFYII